MNQGNSSTNENAYSNDNTINIFEGVAECTMNDSDTLKSVKLRAKDLAIQNVQKKIADYVYSFFRDRYITLPDDEVFAITKEISNITDVKYDFSSSDNDNLIIYATVTAKFDDNNIMSYYIKFFEERTELKLQIEDLKRQIAELTAKIISKDKIALANQKNNEADNLRNKSDYENAIKLYSEAIELNPDISCLYKMRGECYIALGNEEKANEDFAKAKELGW